MAAMSTALTTVSMQGTTVQYALPNHTAAKPRLLIQASSAADGAKRTSQQSLRFVMTAVDAVGNVLPEKDSVELVFKRAKYATGVNLDAAFVTMLRDVINSDEFTAKFMENLPVKAI